MQTIKQSIYIPDSHNCNTRMQFNEDALVFQLWPYDGTKGNRTKSKNGKIKDN